MTARCALATTAAIATLAIGAAAAQAIQFGADLTLPANVPFDCTVLPVPDAFGTNYVPLPSGAPTCTWVPIGTINQPAVGSLLTPITGTVRQVRIRVGPVTGPMQVVVMRAFRDINSTAFPVCCTEVGQTPVFTPTANAVTTLQTSLPVRKDTVPDPINNTLTFDELALSVLAPNVPIPAFDSGIHDPSNFNAPEALVYQPAVGPGQEAFGGSGVGGFQVLLDADVEPGAGAGGTAIRLVQPTVTVRGATAPILLRCDLTTGRCGGVVLLQNRGAAGARAASAHAARTITYGRAHFSIAARKRAHVRVTLTSAGRRLLRGRASARVFVNATVNGRRQKPARLTLKR